MLRVCVCAEQSSFVQFGMMVLLLWFLKFQYKHCGMIIQSGSQRFKRQMNSRKWEPLLIDTICQNIAFVLCIVLAFTGTCFCWPLFGVGNTLLLLLYYLLAWFALVWCVDRHSVNFHSTTKSLKYCSSIMIFQLMMCHAKEIEHKKKWEDFRWMRDFPFSTKTNVPQLYFYFVLRFQMILSG